MSNNESFQQEVFELIQSLIGEKNIIAVPRLFLHATGDLETGTFLAQLLYWTDKGNREDGFIYKTAKEWYEEIYLSKYALNKARKKLEKLGILETMVKKANGNPTVHYKLLKKPLIDWLVKFRKNESKKTKKRNAENEKSLTETTAKNTNINNNDNGRFASEPASYFFRKEEVNFAVKYYFDRYYEKVGHRHPYLKPEQIQRVYEEIASIVNEYNLNADNLRDMIDEHFRRNLDTDWNINHFATEGILMNLMYEVAY